MSRQAFLRRIEENNALFYAELLNGPYKEAFVLYHHGSFSQKEVADKMNVSLYKVRGYLSKALFQIKKQTHDADLVTARRILQCK
jgi:DNA-directed RNA polymerase specialized sigma24 family protein